MEQGPFDAAITLEGPERKPMEMLADQTYGGHASLHDGATADSVGLSGAPIEGPTHFSQFDPLAHLLWGDGWFERGCISAHFRTMVVEGESVTARAARTGPDRADLSAAKADGSRCWPVPSPSDRTSRRRWTSVGRSSATRVSCSWSTRWLSGTAPVRSRRRST